MRCDKNEKKNCACITQCLLALSSKPGLEGGGSLPRSLIAGISLGALWIQPLLYKLKIPLTLSVQRINNFSRIYHV
jgi:hypothetical protein